MSPIATQEQAPQIPKTEEGQRRNKEDLQEKVREQLNELLDLQGRERNEDEEKRFKAVGQELGKTLDALGIKTAAQRKELLARAKELYATKKMETAHQQTKREEDGDAAPLSPEAEKYGEAMPVDQYANLLDLNQESIVALEVGEDINRDLIQAKRDAVSKRDRLGSQLLIEVAKIAFKDMTARSELTVSDLVEQIKMITDAAKTAKKEQKGLFGTKEVLVDSMEEAATTKEVQDAIKALCTTVDQQQNIPQDKKQAFFALLEKATGVAYTSEDRKSDQTASRAKAA